MESWIVKPTPTTKEAYRLLHQGTLAMAHIEANGIRADVDYLKRSISATAEQIAQLEATLYASKEWSAWTGKYGQKASLTSREQLGVVLFELMGHEYKYEKIPSGYSTEEWVLAAVNTEFTQNYTRMQKLLKAKGTYLEGILGHVTPDGLVHPTFSLTTTITYRSSGAAPNFQNIPIRDPEIGKLVRTAFIPRDGNCIIEVDFKGAEVCVGICYHKDAKMLRYNKEGYDMHIGSAIHCFLVREDQINKDLRQHAKGGFTFANFYGDWYKSIAQNIWNLMERYKLTLEDGTPIFDHLRSKGVDKLGICDPKRDPIPGTFEYVIHQADKWLWQEEFTGYAKWRKDWHAEYLKNGFFHTLTGFTIQGPMSKNDCVNYPIQGSAFHCLLWCLIELIMEIIKQKKKTKVIGQIHDSIVADVPMNETDWFRKTLKEIITERLPNAWKWIITPMIAECDMAPPGKSWADKKAVAI